MAEDVATVCQSDESESARIPPCGIVFEALAVFDLLVFVETTNSTPVSPPTRPQPTDSNLLRAAPKEHAFALSLCNAGMAPVAKPIK